MQEHNIIKVLSTISLCNVILFMKIVTKTFANRLKFILSIIDEEQSAYKIMPNIQIN